MKLKDLNINQKDNVEKSTKNANTIENTLCDIVDFTIQSYKIIKQPRFNYKTLND